MSKEILLKRKVVFEESSEELWGSYKWYQFLTEDEIQRDKEECDIDVYTDSYSESESCDISIEDMKRLIKKAEEAGANYIEIDYHPKYKFYKIYGSSITRATKREIEDYEKLKRMGDKMKISGKIRGLEAQIEVLKKELDNI